MRPAAILGAICATSLAVLPALSRASEAGAAPACEDAQTNCVELIKAGYGCETDLHAISPKGVEAGLRDGLVVDGAAAEEEAHGSGGSSLAHLLERYRAYIDARDYDGSTALHHAALSGHVAAVKLLLRHRADVSCATNVGEAPLHLAARGGYAAVTKLLLDANADVHARARSGRTPLQEAARGLGGSGGAALAEMEALLGASGDARAGSRLKKKRARSSHQA